MHELQAFCFLQYITYVYKMGVDMLALKKDCFQELTNTKSSTPVLLPLTAIVSAWTLSVIERNAEMKQLHHKPLI